jgi:hypothetical protein
MARTPRATVSKTSGQGVSRLAYQKAYRSRNSPDMPKVKMEAGGSSASKRDYGKSSSGTDYDAGIFTADYGSTLRPSNLEDVKELGNLKPSKPDVSVERQAKKLKKLK